MKVQAQQRKRITKAAEFKSATAAKTTTYKKQTLENRAQCGRSPWRPSRLVAAETVTTHFRRAGLGAEIYTTIRLLSRFCYNRCLKNRASAVSAQLASK
jgi:hypothetical protein